MCSMPAAGAPGRAGAAPESASAALERASAALERARALAPVLRKRSAAANEARRVPDETVRDLLDAGLFKLLQPRRFGGAEQDLDVFARAAIELARGCGSAGWVFSVLSIHQWMLALFPEEAQHDVWGADPDALVASALRPSAGTAEREEGGYRIGGTWGFASGVENSQWMILGVFVPAGVGPEPGSRELKMMLMPTSEGRVDDNWRVMGLRGTGSKNFVCDNAFVPDHRVLAFQAAKAGEGPGRALNAAPLYAVPAFACLALCVACPGVGAASGAYQRFIEYVATRRSVAQKNVADYATVQLRVAEAAAMIDAAEALLVGGCRRVMETARSGRGFTLEERARFRRDQGYAARTSADAAEKLLRACGAAALFDDFEIRQCYLDAWATASHIGCSWDLVATQFGQVAMGGQPEPLAWV